MKNLGYMNGWGSKGPEAYEKCKEAGHILETKQIYNCVTEYRCSICKHYFRIDSGD